MLSATVNLCYFDTLVKHHTEIFRECINYFPCIGAGESLTPEDLHLLRLPYLRLLSRKLTAYINKVNSDKYHISRMWAVHHQKGEGDISWHNHLCDLSGVYYIKVPKHLSYPEGCFGILTPEPVYIIPREGLFLSFNHSVYHDAVPLFKSNNERLSIAVDFNRSN